MKRCGRCREILPVSAFHRDRTTPDGLKGTCRDCRRDRPLVSRGTRVPFPRSLFDGSNGQVAERLGVSRRNVLRWQSDGLPARRMDAVARELGMHPTEIWDCYYEVAA